VINAPQESAAIDGTEFVGAESRFALGGEEFSLFRGVRAALWDALLRGRPNGLAGRRIVPDRSYEVPGLVRADEVWGFATDGAVARLRRI
jgi:hypothetical protein